MVCSARNTKPERLERALSGDIDNILMMALRKEPERRYGSVEQFANDLRRHLQGHPVTARPDTIRYRTGKFIHRHRTGVVGAALILITLMGGILTTSWQWHVANRERLRAEQRFQEVRGLANAVLFELHDAIVPLPGSTHARELLIKRAKQYLDSLASESSEDDSLQHERAMAYERIGDVLGLPSQPNLGQSAEALASYHKALEIERQLAERNSRQRCAGKHAIAKVYNRICSVQQYIGDFRKSLDSCREAERIQESDCASIRTTWSCAAIWPLRMGTWPAPTFRWAIGSTARSSATASCRNFRSCTACSRTTIRSSMGWPTPITAWPACRSRRSTMPRPRRMRCRLSSCSASLERTPKDILRRVDWTFAEQRLGSILISMGDLRGAQAAFEAVLPIREQLRALDPKDARAMLNLANSHAAIGVVLLELGNALTAQLTSCSSAARRGTHPTGSDGGQLSLQPVGGL